MSDKRQPMNPVLLGLAVQRIEAALRSGVLNEPRHLLYEATLSSFLQNLVLMLKEADRIGKRIAFTDDVQPSEKVRDVTDLIVKARNAATHLDSGHNVFEGGLLVLNRVGWHPKGKGARLPDGTMLTCEYEDDEALYFGVIRVYILRNLIRALNELKQVFPAAFA